MKKILGISVPIAIGAAAFVLTQTDSGIRALYSISKPAGIYATYLKYLHRAPDAAGYANWLKFVSGGYSHAPGEQPYDAFLNAFLAGAQKEMQAKGLA
jgi:hypothetical protein